MFAAIIKYLAYFSLMAGLFIAYGPQAQAQLPEPTDDVVLLVDGAITHKNFSGGARFDQAMIEALPSHTLTTSTAVTDGIKQFSGPLLRDLLRQVGAKGKRVLARALNNYEVIIPVNDFLVYDVLLATHMDGRPLHLSDKGPLWLVYPRDKHRQLQDIRYDYRWVWQLNHLTLQE